AFDVREEQRDDSGREIVTHGSIILRTSARAKRATDPTADRRRIRSGVLDLRALRDSDGAGRRTLAAGEGDARVDDPGEPEQAAELAEVLQRDRGADEGDRGDADRAPAEHPSRPAQRKRAGGEQEEDAQEPRADVEGFVQRY